MVSKQLHHKFTVIKEETDKYINIVEDVNTFLSIKCIKKSVKIQEINMLYLINLYRTLNKKKLFSFLFKNTWDV